MRKDLIKKIELIFVNTITLTRLFGAIALPFIYKYYGSSTFAFWTIILFLTDFLDGFLARTFKISTFFGCALDALSDKVLNACSFILLSLINTSLLLPLILEISIMYTSYSTYRYGGNVQSTKTGKIKTIILDICIIMCFILISLPKYNIDSSIISYLINNTQSFIYFFSSIITISCIIALLDYIKLNTQARKNPISNKIKLTKKTRKTFKKLINDAFDTNYYQKHKNESIMQQLYV
ncbi:MAG: CDP-alcohol phosphatidyltransferase family protein [bacterium]|nr:CDP-alcohol phosphatidyltransferase family protein [bacterium]